MNKKRHTALIFRDLKKNTPSLVMEREFIFLTRVERGILMALRAPRRFQHRTRSPRDCLGHEAEAKRLAYCPSHYFANRSAVELLTC